MIIIFIQREGTPLNQSHTWRWIDLQITDAWFFVVVSGMSRFGRAIRPSGAGMQEDLGSIPLRLFSLFKRCGLWTLSLWLCPSQLMKHYLKWLSSLPILMQESFWWWQHSVRYSLPLPLRSWSPPVPLRKQLGLKQVYRTNERTNEPFFPSLSLSLFSPCQHSLFIMIIIMNSCGAPYFEMCPTRFTTLTL